MGRTEAIINHPGVLLFFAEGELCAGLADYCEATASRLARLQAALFRQ